MGSKASDRPIVAAVVVGLIATGFVLTGSVGGAKLVSQVDEWMGLPVYAYVDQDFTILDGGGHAASILIIAGFMSLASVAALFVILRPQPPRSTYLKMVGLFLGVGGLVASLTAYAVFRSWVMGQRHEDLWVGSSVYAGVIGSLVLIALIGISLWRERRIIQNPERVR
jgi:hypothetical protein